MAFEFFLYDSAEVILIDGVVASEGGAVEIEDDAFLAVIAIVRAEVLDEGGDLPLELDVEGLEHI